MCLLLVPVTEAGFRAPTAMVAPDSVRAAVAAGAGLKIIGGTA